MVDIQSAIAENG